MLYLLIQPVKTRVGIFAVLRDIQTKLFFSGRDTERGEQSDHCHTCLLYTSDAADD